MTAKGIRPIEYRGVPSYLSAGRTVARYHEESSHIGRTNSESLLSDRDRQAHLLVVLAERRLDGSDLGLDFDDENRGACPVDGKDVDRASLAISGIARLRDDVPGQRPEPGND
jgi:hypothetical protein